MYVTDILAIHQLSAEVKRALINALLQTAFLPELVRSLVIMNTKN